MVDEYELNLMQRNCIFIDQLPLEYKEEALKHYPCKYCCNVYEEGKGLHIYFHDDKQALEYSRSRIIWIKGKSFMVSLSATNLTVHGISASVPELQALMKFHGYDDIVRVYPVGDETELNTYVPIINNRDYRIVWKIPEIYAISLIPITWHKQGCLPETFSVTFFCRFCRQDGHKSFDCRLFPQSESFTGKHVERQMSLPSDMRNLYLEQCHRQGDITVNATISISQDADPHSSYTSDVFNPPASTSEAHLNMTDPLEHTSKSLILLMFSAQIFCLKNMLFLAEECRRERVILYHIF